MRQPFRTVRSVRPDHCLELADMTGHCTDANKRVVAVWLDAVEMPLSSQVALVSTAVDLGVEVFVVGRDRDVGMEIARV